MALPASGNITLLQVVAEVLQGITADPTLTNCYAYANPAVTPANPFGVSLTDFYGHTQYANSHIEARNTSSYASIIRDNNGNGGNLTSSYLTFFTGNPATTTVRFYKSGVVSFTSGDGVVLYGWRRLIGASIWTSFLTTAPYTSGTVSVDVWTYDYRFSLENW